MSVSSSPQRPVVVAAAPHQEDCREQRSRWLRASQLATLHGLNQLTQGKVWLTDGCDEFLLGAPSIAAEPVTVTVHHPAFYRNVALQGHMGAAASFIEGHWSCENLPQLLRLFAREIASGKTPAASRTLQGLHRLNQLRARVSHWLSRNTIRGSRRNIIAHYDLGNDFFRLFLDKSMMYSSAIFENAEMTLEEAQQHRLQVVCSHLNLNSDDHVVEIGTGWGGFAEFAAKHYGCRVTTTTISDEQFHYASERVKDAGLADRVNVIKEDYRRLTGSYSKLVSLEMIEAVGPQFYDTYFSKCSRLLQPGGRMLIQAIVIPDQRYAQYLKSVDFIRRFVFPGGSLPSIGALQAAVSRTSDLRLVHLSDFAADYATTLQRWRTRFHQNLHKAAELGYDARFLRLWDFYFAYCEAGFAEQATGVVHAVWDKPLSSAIAKPA